MKSTPKKHFAEFAFLKNYCNGYKIAPTEQWST